MAVLLLLLLLRLVDGADISLEAICGNRLVDSCPKKISLKVIGGTSSCAEKVPWNVLVEHATSTNKAAGGGVFPYCGGLLVTEQHVVSAAHCFWTNENQFGTCPKKFLGSDHDLCKRTGCPASCSRLGPEDVRLYLGLTRRTQARAGQGREVAAIVIHPGWDRSKKLNDILAGHDLAVLRMARPLDRFSRTTVPICLPSPRDSYLLKEGNSGDISGFGVVIEPVSGALKHPTELQTARVSLTSTVVCKNWWNTKGGQICAAGSQKIESSSGLDLVADSCNGDSGGGLTATNFNGREVLLGIVSFGETDCGRRGGKPGVYTNVLDHIDWLTEQISGQSARPTTTTTTTSRPPPPPPGPAPGGAIQFGVKCITSNGKQCKFPFKFRNKVFASCTSDFDADDRPWCSTEVNSRGEASGEFGYCPASCPVNILTTPSPPVRPASSRPSAPWSAWSQCSASCGAGTQQRSRRCGPDRTCTRKQPCRAATCPTGGTREWTAWAACSVSCGGGTQARTQVGTNVAQTQGCNIQACPEDVPARQACRLLRAGFDLGEDFFRWTRVRSLARCQADCLAEARCAGLTWVQGSRNNCALYDAAGARTGTATRGQDSYICSPTPSGGSSGSPTLPGSSSSSSPSSPPSSASPRGASSSWLVGGDGRLGRSVESIGASATGGLCGKELASLPAPRASMMGGYLGGRVLACGGSTGGRGQAGVHTDCWAAAPSGGAWRRAASMPHNTSNAGHAVAGGKLYVAGGYTQPLCGYRPELQVYSPATGWSAPSALDPPHRVGAYSCAVAVGAQIFFIGGWYPPSVYTSECREDRYEGRELDRVNKDITYFHNRVQVLDTNTGLWQQGPPLQFRRRNHGCTLAQVGSRQGLLVAGGDSPREGALRSVEYLDLGPAGAAPGLEGRRWRSLPDMARARTKRLVLYAEGGSVFAMGGSSVEALDLARPVWRTITSTALQGRGHSLVVPGVPADGTIC